MAEKKYDSTLARMVGNMMSNYKARSEDWDNIRTDVKAYIKLAKIILEELENEKASSNQST